MLDITASEDLGMDTNVVLPSCCLLERIKFLAAVTVEEFTWCAFVATLAKSLFFGSAGEVPASGMMYLQLGAAVANPLAGGFAFSRWTGHSVQNWFE